jgi:hypothetical protein
VKPNLERYRHFDRLLKAEGMTDIGLVIKCRPNDVDPELFTLLKGMGLVRAYVGIETNSDEGIVSLNRRISPEDNRRAMAILRELDIYNSFNVLIFDPEATLDGIARNLDFLEEHRDIPFNFCRAEVYAGTPLKRVLEEDGRLVGDYLGWGYQMRDPRVELMFRVVMMAFNRRNFDSDGIHSLNMGIRFDIEALRRFYPDVWSPALSARGTALSSEIGSDDVVHMRRVLAFCQTCRVDDAEAIRAFALDVARAVAGSDLRFLAGVKALRRVVERGLSEQRFPHDDAPVWAAETRRLSSSSGRELSTELLPPPAPVGGGRGAR